MKYMLYTLVIIAFLDTFTQLPIISPFAQSLEASPLMIGFIVGMYSFTNLIGNVIAGKWIDQHGAQRILMIGLGATAAVLLLYTLVDTPAQLFAVRSLHGLTGGLLVPSVFTLISRRVQTAKQGKNMAYSGAAVGLAAVMGPAIGGIVKVHLGIDAVFFLVAGLMGIGAWLTGWRLTPTRLAAYAAARGKAEIAQGNAPKSEITTPLTDSAKLASHNPVAQRSMTVSSQWIPLLRNPYAVQAYIGAFSLMFTMGILTYMLPLKAESLLLSEQTSGYLFSIFGLVAILFFVLPTNRIFDTLASRTTMLIGMSLIAIAVWGLSIFSETRELYLTMALYGLGFAFLFPSINSLLVENVPEEDRGKAFGLFYAFYSIGVVVGSIFIGMVAPTPDGGFLIGAVFMLVVVLSLGLTGKRLT